MEKGERGKGAVGAAKRVPWTPAGYSLKIWSLPISAPGKGGKG